MKVPDNFIIHDYWVIVCCESKSILLPYPSMSGRISMLIKDVLPTISDINNWELHIVESEEQCLCAFDYFCIKATLKKFKNTYLYCADLNFEENLKILNLPEIKFGGTTQYSLLNRTLRHIAADEDNIPNTRVYPRKKFIFQNGVSRTTRLRLMDKIFEHKIDDDFYLSWLMRYGYRLDIDASNMFFNPTVEMVLDTNDLNSTTQERISMFYNESLIDIFVESISSIWSWELNKNNIEDNNRSKTPFSIEEDYVSHELNVCFITEKTWKPICAGKPFLGFGPQYYYKYLRSEGWETYDTIFDYSFDDIEDERERLDRWFKDNILRLSKMTIEEIQKLIKLDADKIEKNKIKAFSQVMEVPEKLKHFIPSGIFKHICL